MSRDYSHERGPASPWEGRSTGLMWAEFEHGGTVHVWVRVPALYWGPSTRPAIPTHPVA